MPIDPSLIVAGAGLVGSIFNAGQQNKTNADNWRLQNQLQDKQNAYNLKMFNLQNDYNSPTSQMNRLRQANLNPNLVYGNNGGMVAATAPQASTSQASRMEAPRVDLASPMADYFNTKTQQAQYDNLKVQNTVLLEESLLKKAQRQGVEANTAMTLLNTDIKSPMKQYSAEFAKGTLEKLNTEIDRNINQNLLTGFNAHGKAIENDVAESTKQSRIRAAKSTADLREKQLQLMELDRQLKSKGIQPNDPLYMRILGRYFGDDLESVLKRYKQQ